MAGRTTAVVTVVAAGTLLLGACNRNVSIDDWLTRADGVCRTQQAAADADPAPQSPLPGDALRHLAKQSRSELDALRALPQTEEQRSSVAEYLLTLEHRIDVLNNFADELDAAPARGPEPDRTRLEDITTQANTQAVALGLEACGGGVDVGVSATTTTAPVLSGGPGGTESPTTASGDQDVYAEDGPG